MERLTERNKNSLAMASCCGKACEYNYVCEVGGFGECRGMDDIIDRLADIEDILGDDYDLDRLRVIVNQRISLREEVHERIKLTGDIPLDRLRELVEAVKAGRIKILPEYTGKVCGTCGHFLRIVGTCRGKCAVKPLASSRYGSWNTPFEPSQSRKACKQYKLQKEAQTNDRP